MHTRKYGITYRVSSMITRNTPKYFSLAQIPVEERTEKVCHEFVTRDGRQLSYVPRELITRELCAAALAQSNAARQWVPSKFMDSEMVAPYVNDCPRIVRRMPRHHKTIEIYQQAARAGLPREYCPPQWRDEIYGHVVKKYVPRHVPRNKKISKRRRGEYVTGAERLAQQENRDG